MVEVQHVRRLSGLHGTILTMLQSVNLDVRRVAFGNGALSVKRDFHLRPQVGRVVGWRDGGAGGAEISHVGAMPAPGHKRMDAVGRRALRLLAVSRPARVHASVRGQRKAANIMPGPVRSRAPISQACSNASVRRRGNARRLGDRVPVGTWDGRRLRARPEPSASSPATVGAHAAAPEHQAAPAAVGRVKRKSAPSTHIRCRITPIRRAMATTARFIPRRRATCRPHAFSQHGLAWCIITVAAW